MSQAPYLEVVTERDVGQLEPLATIDVDLVGPLTSTSVTPGVRSSGSSLPAPRTSRRRWSTTDEHRRRADGRGLASEDARDRRGRELLPRPGEVVADLVDQRRVALDRSHRLAPSSRSRTADAARFTGDLLRATGPSPRSICSSRPRSCGELDRGLVPERCRDVGRVGASTCRTHDQVSPRLRAQQGEDPSSRPDATDGGCRRDDHPATGDQRRGRGSGHPARKVDDHEIVAPARRGERLSHDGRVQPGVHGAESKHPDAAPSRKRVAQGPCAEPARSRVEVGPPDAGFVVASEDQVDPGTPLIEVEQYDSPVARGGRSDGTGKSGRPDAA